MLGPSEGALSGSWCVSMKSPATPTATAARASTGTKAAVAAGGGALSARTLHGVGGVEDHGTADPAHDGERAHVDDERVVAERGAALRHQHVGVAAARDLVDDVLHVPGGEELALLDLDGAAGPGRGDDKVRLPAQEGRDLQHVHHLGQLRALLGVVHVGDDGDAEARADLGEHRQCAVQADAAPGLSEVRLALSKEVL